MKNSCDVIRDLLPLYHDNVCSEESNKMVEAHLQECQVCRNMLKKMKDNTYDSSLQSERENVITHYKQEMKKKMMGAGISVAVVLAIPILVCLIINLATGHALDWFFIVLTSLMVVASVSVVPLIIEERKFLWTIGSFTASLMVLLLTCNLYSRGSWFFVTSVACLFGLSVIFLPFVVYQLPLKGFAVHNKGLLVLSVDTVLLYALIITCGLYGSFTNWGMALGITTVNVSFVWVLFVIIRYLKVNGFIRSGLCLILSGIFVSLIQDIITFIIEGTLSVSFLHANLGTWNYQVSDANVNLIMLISGCAAGAVMLIMGSLHKYRKKSMHN